MVKSGGNTSVRGGARRSPCRRPDRQNILGSGSVSNSSPTTATVPTFAARNRCSNREGKKGQPRFKPPFPASFGLYGKPTTINNTETFASIPFILKMGGEEFSTGASPTTAGPSSSSVSGHVNRPAIVEILWVRLPPLLEMCGGDAWRDNLKAVIPGGASAPVVPGAVMMETPWTMILISKG